MKKLIAILMGVIAMVAPQLKKVDSKVGVKETMEAIKAVMAIAIFLCKKLSDGAQFQDAVDFYAKITADEEFKTLLANAWEGRQLIKAEIKDTDTGEALELTGAVLESVPAIIETFEENDEAEAVS